MPSSTFRASKSVGRSVLCRAIESLENRSYLAAISFASPVQLLTQGVGSSAISADVNGDSLADIIAVNSSSNSLSIFINKGAGAFNPAVNLATAARPTAVVTGLFNNDNALDIAVVQSDVGTVGIFLGAGTGAFSERADYLYDTVTSGASTIDRIVSSDFNSDSIPDLLIATASGNDLVTMGGLGDGSFVRVTGKSIVSPSALAVRDLNGDGPLDIVSISGTSPSLQIFYGLGDGSFGLPASYAIGSASELATGGLLIADVNADTIPDLLATTRSGTQDRVTVLVGKGNGTFDTAPIHSNIPTTNGSLAIADFDNNSYPDLIFGLSGSGGQSDVVTGSITGTFSAALGLNLQTGAWTSLALADFNGDSRRDLFSPSGSSASGNLILNTTGVIVKTATVTGLSTDVNPSDFNSTITLSANVSSAIGAPSGKVIFYDGAKTLGSAVLDANGNASLATAKLAPGVHQLKAKFAGTSRFAASFSSVVSQTVVATPTNILSTAKRMIIKSIAVPGDVGTVVLSLQNQGGTLGQGAVAVQLFASADGTIDENDVALIAPKLASVAIKLAAGKSRTISGKFTIPTTLTPGTYQVLVRSVAISGAGLADSDVNSTALSMASITNYWSFGTIGTRRGVKLITTTGDGTKITYTLAGAGMGSVDSLEAGNINLTTTATSIGSTLSILAKGGAATVGLSGLTTDSPLGTIKAPTTDFAGALHVAGDSRKIQLRNVSSSTLILDGTSPRSIVLGDLLSSSLQSSGPITTLTAGNVSANLAAPLFGTVTIRGNMSDSKLLAGASFGGDGTLDGANDTYGAGTIRSLKILGAISTSLVAGGIDPVDGQFLNGDDVLLAGGSINAVVIASGDSVSRVLASTLPKRVKVAGVSFAPANHVMFMLG